MRGYSLIEILVAVLLIAIALLALAGVQAVALRSQQGVGGRHTASVVAASVMGECEAALKQDFTADVTRSRAPYAGQPGYEVSVSQRVESPLLRRVDVSVYWRDEHDDAHEYRLWTRAVRE
ncbi:MAG: prepilin-type N-terminal cleavage/methylation domain-containing protein [Candidatus Eremiobacterota bacterium]